MKFEFKNFLRKTKDKLLMKKLFPCKKCVLRACCSQLCDDIEQDHHKLLDIVMTYKCCPDCGAKDFYFGPSGGLSQNTQCSSCRHKFNSCLPLSFDRIGVFDLDTDGCQSN